jgi:hypothetical protein
MRRDLLRDLIAEGLEVAQSHLEAARACNHIAADGDTRHHLKAVQTCFRAISDAFGELDVLK